MMYILKLDIFYKFSQKILQYCNLKKVFGLSNFFPNILQKFYKNDCRIFIHMGNLDSSRRSDKFDKNLAQMK